MKLHATNMPVILERYILATLGLILLLLPVHAFISTWGGTEIGPLLIWKSWKEILLVPAVGLAAVWALSRPEVMKQLLRDWIVVLTVIYALLVSLFIQPGVMTNGQDAAFAGVAFDLRYFAMFLLGYLVFRYGTFDKQRVLNVVVRVVIVAGLILAVIGIAQVTIIPRDFLSQFGYEKFVTIAPYLTIDEKSPDLIRAFATLRGPNDYGAFLVMALAFALVTLTNAKYKLAAAVLLLSGVFVSHSRSAYIAAATVIFLWLLMTIGVVKIKKYWAYAAVGAVVAVGLASLSLISPTVRLIVFHSSENDTHLTEGPIEAHADAIVDTTSRVAEEPLGCGAGCSGPASYYGPHAQISENYYLQIAEQYGFVGLGLWLAIFILVMQALYKQSRKHTAASALFISGIGLSVIGVLLHVWADDPLSMTWWGIAGSIIGFSAIQPHFKKGS